MRNRSHRGQVLMLWSGLAAVAGCNFLTPLVFIGEHKKSVSAEFDKLPHRRVVLLVWTDPATLFDYPFARFELATYAAERLHADMGQRRLDTDVVDPRDVEEFLQRHPDAQIDPWQVGRHFDADYVIYLEILSFQMRNPEQPQFLQGRIEASVAVHDVQGEARERFELEPVDCVYPDGAPILMRAGNAPLVRESVYRKFAEEVARKFYDHTVDL